MRSWLLVDGGRSMGYSLTQMFLIVSAYELTRAELENWRAAARVSELGGFLRCVRRTARETSSSGTEHGGRGWVDGWMDARCASSRRRQL